MCLTGWSGLLGDSHHPEYSRPAPVLAPGRDNNLKINRLFVFSAAIPPWHARCKRPRSSMGNAEQRDEHADAAQAGGGRIPGKRNSDIGLG
jgi:hypothetical protein